MVLHPLSVDEGAPFSPAPPAQGDILQAGSCMGHPVCSGAELGLVPRQEGRELGRAGRSAPAGKGSGVSCRVQWGFQQPMVGLLIPSTAQSWPHLAWGQGWGDFPSCLVSLVDGSHCFISAGLFLSLLPPWAVGKYPSF